MKKLFFFIQGLIIYPFLALPAYAQLQGNADPCFNSGSNPISQALCNLGGGNIANTIRNIVVFFVVIAVIIALMYLLYGGVKWITSRGEKTEVEAARNHIMAAIIGLIVVFLAIFIISVVLAAFGLEFNSLTIPKITTN